MAHCYGCGRLNHDGHQIKSYWDGEESVCHFQPKLYHTAIPGYVNGDLSKVSAQVVYEAAHDGDDHALEVVRDTAKVLGAGVANIVNIFNPEVVVICGGVTLAGDKLFVPLRSEVKRRAFKPAVEVCRIVPGELTGTAGVYGAAAVFMKRTWGRV